MTCKSKILVIDYGKFLITFQDTSGDTHSLWIFCEQKGNYFDYYLCWPHIYVLTICDQFTWLLWCPNILWRFRFPWSYHIHEWIVVCSIMCSSCTCKESGIWKKSIYNQACWYGNICDWQTFDVKNMPRSLIFEVDMDFPKMQLFTKYSSSI